MKGYVIIYRQVNIYKRGLMSLYFASSYSAGGGGYCVWILIYYNGLHFLHTRIMCHNTIVTRFPDLADRRCERQYNVHCGYRTLDLHVGRPLRIDFIDRNRGRAHGRKSGKITGGGVKTLKNTYIQ